MKGDLTYDGNGGTIKDASAGWVKQGKHWSYVTTPGVFTSNINVAESFSISDVNLSLNNLEHSNWSDLEISLSHGDKVMWLTSGQGGSKDADGNYIFDDAAAKLISSGSGNWKPGTYLSKDPLSVFNGLDSAGLWTLQIHDTNSNWKAGELCDWTLQLAATPPRRCLSRRHGG